MFLKNFRYVRAQPEEVTRSPPARTIRDQPIVSWRTEHGTATAAE